MSACGRQGAKRGGHGEVVFASLYIVIFTIHRGSIDPRKCRFASESQTSGLIHLTQKAVKLRLGETHAVVLEFFQSVEALRSMAT